jgi:hypothetical protein
MSPKEQATAVQLLTRWLEVSRRMLKDDPEIETVFQTLNELEELRLKTQGFIDHEADE